MCTYIMKHSPGTSQPVIMATTRDESGRRPTTEPFLWKEKTAFIRPLRFIPDFGNNYHITAESLVDAGIVAPKDIVNGGTYMGINRHGILVAVNNREYSPKDDGLVMSRGALVVQALNYDDPEFAARYLYEQFLYTQKNSERKYPGINLMIANKDKAFVLTNARCEDVGEYVPPANSNLKRPKLLKFDSNDYSDIALYECAREQVSMIANFNPDDMHCERVSTFLPRFRELSIGRYDKMLTSPVLHKPNSWGTWLSEMVYEASLNDPFYSSIGQPEYDVTDSHKRGAWITISTELVVMGEKGDFEWMHIPSFPQQGEMQGYLVKQDGSKKLLKLELNGTDLTVEPYKVLLLPESRSVSSLSR